MGFLDDIMDTEGPRTKALKSLTLQQLRALAKERDIELKDTSLFGTGDSLKSKDAIVEKLANAETKLPMKVIQSFMARVEAGESPGTEDKQIPVTQKAPLAPMTPTVAPNKSQTLVSFDEVVAYIDEYRFISRYSEEGYYEVELAGALREHFGTVTRQMPVPVPGKRLAIDLDVGGVGIEIKANITAAQPLRAALSQLGDYRQHYGDKLIFLLIGTHGLDAQKNDIRATGVVFIEK